jgi:hypothetical protein
MHFKAITKTLSSLFVFHRTILFYRAQRFGNWLCFRLQARKAATPVNPLKIAIISHYLQGSTRVGDVLALKRKAQPTSETWCFIEN